MRGVINELRRTPLGNCLKRGSRDAPGGYLARVLGPKQAERDGLGALWARVSGTSGTFQTVSRRSSYSGHSRKSRTRLLQRALHRARIRRVTTPNMIVAAPARRAPTWIH